jgi:hypothetical protein
MSNYGAFDKLDDREYLKKKYKASTKQTLNLENPQNFNEKIQWLKLYDRKPEYTMMVDKYKVRDYIAKTIGKEYLIPLLGVWDNPDEIDFDKLPDQFVLKCNHNSGGGMCICKDKSKLNIKKVKSNLRKGLKQNYYMLGREWPYKDVPRRIICEQYMTDESGIELKDYKIHNFNGIPKFIEVDFGRFAEHKRNKSDDLVDYKFYCFNGKPEYCQVISGRFTDERMDFYDMEWNHQEFTKLSTTGKPFKNADYLISRPKTFELMKKSASILSVGCPFVRIDFYEVAGKMYFGEFTLYPASGFGVFEPDEWNYIIGEKIALH